jgi:transposase
VDRIEPHIVKRAIEAQMCPWCGAGPYRALACHTNRAHGVDKVELRTLAGLPWNASICDPDYSSARREEVMSRPDWDEVSKKGQAASRKAEAWKAGQASRIKRLRADNVERDSEIVQAVLSGTFRGDVAERFGVAKSTVTAILHRAGIEEDGRAQAAKLRERDGKRADVMRAGFILSKERERTSRVSKFVDLGGSWDALEAMAKEEGRTRRQMADILRRAGANVPDGRSVSPHRQWVANLKQDIKGE